MLDKDIIHSLQILIADIIESAKSGHPGSAITLTPFYLTLTKHLRYDPDDHLWCDRDIVILSNGHTCLVYYIMLHLMRFDTTNTKLKLTDLVAYRKIDSLTPGHPETLTPGIEVCTGPLGQGLANSNGFALSQQKVRGSGVTVCVFGDGCYQEGISHEAFALAAMYSTCTIFVYDSNKITIDGSVELSMNESQVKRFEAYGFYVVEVAGDDNKTLDNVLRIKLEYLRGRHSGEQRVQGESGRYDIELLCSDRLLMIVLNTKIASGTICEGNAKAHGAPIGLEAIKDMKKKYGFEDQGLEINSKIYEHFKEQNKVKRAERKAWNETMVDLSKAITNNPELAKDSPYFCYDPNFDWLSKDRYKYKVNTKELNNLVQSLTDKNITKKMSTRKALNEMLKYVLPAMPYVISGSADLTPSCLTRIDTSVDIAGPFMDGEYLRYGIREHGMFGMMLGLSSHGFFLPLGSTFLNFVTYGWHGIRLTALARRRAIYIGTHDSVCLGEDGPTHQPVETMACLRALPGIHVFRPCDLKELVGCFMHAIHFEGPSFFALSRQDIDLCSEIYNAEKDKLNQNNTTFCDTSTELCVKGAYYVYKGDRDIVIYATGSEVALCMKVAITMGASLVSFPCFELFETNDREYKKMILPDNKFKVSVEALSTFGWQKYVDYSIGVTEFGLSGKWQEVYKRFGFEENVILGKINSEYDLWKEKK